MGEDDVTPPPPNPENPVTPPTPNPDNPTPEPVNPPAPNPNDPDPVTPQPAEDMTKVKIKKGTGYTKFIKDELARQGYTNPTKEQIKKAKQQFEAANPKTKGNQAYVHTYNGAKSEWKGNKYLIADLEYNVPKFVFD